MCKFWLLSLGLLISYNVYAHGKTPTNSDIASPSPWHSQIEFGYQAHSGNTDSQSLNGRVKGEYISG
ncbi:DUF481 domain-containing protein, partial [Vibrio sp. V27_P1S3P104]|uniref:DUF481 domain-containing protein n=2 Tax=unclassified Vibrio TaxID=2614977 RepID=UPI003075E3DD